MQLLSLVPGIDFQEVASAMHKVIKLEIVRTKGGQVTAIIL